MKPHLHPSPTLFVSTLILAIIIVRFPTIWCQTTSRYETCGEPVECGNDQLEYPFWVSARRAFCGHPSFQLNCQSDVFLLRYESLEYRVLRMDTSTQTITVARNDLWDTNCPQDLYNTTYNTTFFDGNNFDQEDISLYYRCNSSTLTPVLAARPSFGFSCDDNQTENKTESYFYRTSSIENNLFDVSLLVQCNNHIRVPVNQDSATQLGTPTATTDQLRSAITAGFNLRWTAYRNECDRCMRSNGRCGSNVTSPESFACYCASGDFPFTCNNLDLNSNDGGGSKGAFNTKWKLVIGFSCGIIGIMFLLFVILGRKKRLLKSQKASNHQIEIFIRNHGSMAPKRFKYLEIKKMTNSFVEKLGQGGFGSVYKGQLHNRNLVAVKLLDAAMGDGEDFINEVASISKTSHVNIVTFLGFCFEGKKKALIYEFMPNGSLDKFLRGDGSRLDWKTLFRIAKGIARGLEYLHQGCSTRIVHFDIKPHNILLDEEFVPKISDFGLAKLCQKKESIMSVMDARGTVGYMAPEVFFRSLGGASHKSDVYSYGMMVLEMSGACKNINTSVSSTTETYFLDSIYNQIEAGDNLEVDGVTSKEDEELARKMVMVSLWCIQSDPSNRPSISKVVEMLEGSFESLQVPPRRFWSSSPNHCKAHPITHTELNKIESKMQKNGLSSQHFQS